MLGMSMGMSLFQEMEQSQELRLELTGGWTSSIFPKVEEWLRESSDHQHALLYVRNTHAWQDDYRSVIDYVYAMCFPARRKDVKRYYLSGREEHLCGAQLTRTERDFMQAFMLASLAVAYQCHCEKRRAGWKTIREAVTQLAA